MNDQVMHLCNHYQMFLHAHLLKIEKKFKILKIVRKKWGSLLPCSSALGNN